MASRLLSNTLQTLQTRAGLSKQLSRPLATAVAKQGFATRTTVLPNGFTIATEENPSAGAATVGVWVEAGSRLETPQTHGVANFLERATVQSKNASLEKLGGVSTSATTQEQTFFATTTLGSKVSESVEILGDALQNSQFDDAVLEKARASVLKQQDAVSNNEGMTLIEHLYATAFQGEALGRPVAGYKETIESLTAKDLSAFQNENYVARRMVLVGAGDVDHDALVRDAEKMFGGLETGAEAAYEKPSFTGSEIRYRDDALPRAHIAYAVEGAPYLSVDYFNLSVMQKIIGSWDRTLSGANNLTSRLSAVVSKNHLADSFVSFNKGYKDTGLFGTYFVSQNRTQLDDFIHFLQKEWNRLSTTVTPSEVEIAKQQLAASLLLKMDSTGAVAQDIGSQVLASGKRLSPAELKDTINKISVKDIHATGSKYIWDQELAGAGLGPVEAMTDYTRTRGNMAYNRY
ncbi:Metalloenzyme, LuxS/M16 peptidase-like protein [Zychaea mexicana]|uniref:Metalloenzyme, LuxS/M16 peptidase-like protein n=1 Tax=Zychaea mexicana TaxID=64656 RepID=UPI0022FDE6F8|nr:Metalloenzyme, LuxS/M16 peptidase-like protein [Zychaea mexicana]KAI9497346.1 Metalloenzyme, LuxS/M16 peptidase-like protein [Zychaea mexicana]